MSHDQNNTNCPLSTPMQDDGNLYDKCSCQQPAVEGKTWAEHTMKCQSPCSKHGQSCCNFCFEEFGCRCTKESPAVEGWKTSADELSVRFCIEFENDLGSEVSEEFLDRMYAFYASQITKAKEEVTRETDFRVSVEVDKAKEVQKAVDTILLYEAVSKAKEEERRAVVGEIRKWVNSEYDFATACIDPLDIDPFLSSLLPTGDSKQL